MYEHTKHALLVIANQIEDVDNITVAEPVEFLVDIYEALDEIIDGVEEMNPNESAQYIREYVKGDK